MLRYTIAFSLAGVFTFGYVSEQPTACGETLTAEQQARRRSAMLVARQINTFEAQAFSSARKYVALPSLKELSVPEGFDVQVSTDGEGYVFFVKDTKDQCQAALFSDQSGVIYTGAPLR
jgi:hypothetical protein